MQETANMEPKGDKVHISEEVIAIIAGIAASGIENVTSLSGGFTDGLASMLGRKNYGKGVKVQTTEREAAIELSIIVEYGCKIHLVARNIQNKVRESVENMTDLKVTEVAVNVVGVNVEKETISGEDARTES